MTFRNVTLYLFVVLIVAFFIGVNIFPAEYAPAMLKWTTVLLLIDSLMFLAGDDILAWVKNLGKR